MSPAYTSPRSVPVTGSKTELISRTENGKAGFRSWSIRSVIDRPYYSELIVTGGADVVDVADLKPVSLLGLSNRPPTVPTIAEAGYFLRLRIHRFC